MAGKKGDIPPHGGRVFEVARRLGVDPGRILDYSANINPLGPPPGLALQLRRAFSGMVHYPDPHAEPLVADLASALKIKPGRVLAGNGSTALFYLICRALKPERGVIFEPGFGEYHGALRAAGAEVVSVPCKRADLLTIGPEAIEAAIKAKSDIIFVAQPASPSGALPDEDLLDELIRRAAPAVVVLDEAFIDFTPRKSWAAWRRPNLIVTRSMTKFFALTGLRLGYLVGPERLVSRLRAIDEPWSINTPAQVAGRFCLRQNGYSEKSRAMVDRRRERLTKAVEDLPGAHVYPSTANYILVWINRPGPVVSRLAAKLEDEGVLIRDCANFKGVGPNHVRLAVRREGENRRLMAALKKWWDKA